MNKDGSRSSTWVHIDSFPSKFHPLVGLAAYTAISKHHPTMKTPKSAICSYRKVFLELACPFLRGHFQPALGWLLGRWRCLKVFFRKLRVTHFGKTVRAKKRFAKPFTPPCHHWGKRRESIEEPHGEHGGIVQGKQKMDASHKSATSEAEINQTYRRESQNFELRAPFRYTKTRFSQQAHSYIFVSFRIFLVLG